MTDELDQHDIARAEGEGMVAPDLDSFDEPVSHDPIAEGLDRG